MSSEEQDSRIDEEAEIGQEAPSDELEAQSEAGDASLLEQTAANAPPSPPRSDTSTSKSKTSTIRNKPKHLTTTTHSTPHNKVNDSSLVSPAPTTTSTMSNRSAGSHNGSLRGFRRGPTVPTGVGNFANSTFASRQRSVTEQESRKGEDGKPIWR